MRNLFPLAVVFLFGALPLRAETWVKVKTPHFTVISSGSEKDTRQVAAGFEQIHAVFAFAFPQLRTDSGAETIIIAPSDEKSMTNLLPFEKKAIGFLPAGEYHGGWEKDFVIIRLDVSDKNRSLVYYEYVQKLLRLNFTRIPPWLYVGLPEFFSNILIRNDGIFIGAPSHWINLLRAKAVPPLHTILFIDLRRDYSGEDNAEMFHAEAWALTHLLMLGPDMGNGQHMTAYLRALQKGAESQKAFEEAFGKLDGIQKLFSNYTHRLIFNAMRIDQLPPISPDSFALASMSKAETDARLGSFYTYAREMDLADQRLTAALAEDHKLSLAHENAAFLYFQQGKDQDAKGEFDEAVALDPNAYLSLYYRAMMEYHGKTDPESFVKLDAAMQKVLQLNPRYAPAVVVRSQLLVRQGNLQEAFGAAAQAARLEPDRGGYQTNAAKILVLERNYAEAIKITDVVAARWFANDSAEALEVADEARRLGGIEETKEERGQREEEMKYAHDTITVDGVVKSVACEKSKPMEIVLQRGDDNLTFQSGKPFRVGFSDTLWYGRDHFTPCHHVEGMKAVVRYVPSSDPGLPNQMRSLEIRDELIPTSINAGN